MKLSDVQERGIVKVGKRRGIVVDRCPEDRSSGITTVQFEDGDRHNYVWDHEDPEVEYLGQGKLKLKLVLEKKP